MLKAMGNTDDITEYDDLGNVVRETGVRRCGLHRRGGTNWLQHADQLFFF